MEKTMYKNKTCIGKRENDMKMLLPLFASYAEKVAHLEARVLKVERYVFLAARSESWARSDELEDLLSQYTRALADALRSLEHTS